MLRDGQYFVQGYLNEQPSIRYRFIDNDVIVTIKKEQGDGSRFEFETIKSDATETERLTLKQLSLVPPIEKIRYRIPFDGLVWEVDVYQGENRGLITVDIELPEIGHKLQFPKWVDAQQEITHDPRFFNINLGRKPYASW